MKNIQSLYKVKLIEQKFNQKSILLKVDFDKCKVIYQVLLQSKVTPKTIYNFMVFDKLSLIFKKKL